MCRAAKFFWYLLFSYLTLLYFTFYGMMAVAVSPHVQLAAVISSAFYSLWFLFAGFLIPRPVRACTCVSVVPIAGLLKMERNLLLESVGSTDGSGLQPLSHVVQCKEGRYW